MPDEQPSDNCGDVRLYRLLTNEEFADHAFELLSASLVGYAFPILIGWVASGRIYRECTNHGFPLNPSGLEREHLIVHGEETEDLVGETLGLALVMLRRQAVTGGQTWDPEGGAALTTYFVGACVRSFPTPWRRWSREFRRRPVPTDSESPVLTRLAVPDPTGPLDDESALIERLTQMPSEVRRIVELKMDGLTHRQIAACLGMRDARAVDRAMARLRRELRPAGGRR